MVLVLTQVLVCSQDGHISSRHLQIAIRSDDALRAIFLTPSNSRLRWCLVHHMDAQTAAEVIGPASFGAQEVLRRAAMTSEASSASTAAEIRKLVKEAGAGALEDYDGTGSMSRSASQVEVQAKFKRGVAEWSKKREYPVTDMDLALLVKSVHPMYSLSTDAAFEMTVLVYELLRVIADL